MSRKATADSSSSELSISRSCSCATGKRRQSDRASTRPHGIQASMRWSTPHRSSLVKRSTWIRRLFRPCRGTGACTPGSGHTTRAGSSRTGTRPFGATRPRRPTPVRPAARRRQAANLATATQRTISEGQEAHLPLPFALEPERPVNQIVCSLSDSRFSPVGTRW